MGGRHIDVTCTLTRLEIKLASQVCAIDLESNPSPFNVGTSALTTRHHWPGLVAILFLKKNFDDYFSETFYKHVYASGGCKSKFLNFSRSRLREF